MFKIHLNLFFTRPLNETEILQLLEEIDYHCEELFDKDYDGYGVVVEKKEVEVV